MNRTDILMIVNEYLMLDVISGKVTSDKELVNKMVDKLASQLEPPVKPEIADDIEEVVLMLGRLQLRLADLITAEHYNNVADFIHQAREYLINIE